ncbi:MAG TPA: hypothetical protein VN257_11970 [Actinotalea sp.]|nr:hypothetical protein [Actinotalea sp.]
MSVDGTTARAAFALGALVDALDRARDGLDHARQVAWVSDAADGYRDLLDRLEHDVAALAHQVAQQAPVVLRHTRSAELAEAVQRATGVAAVPEGTRGGSTVPDGAGRWE